MAQKRRTFLKLLGASGAASLLPASALQAVDRVPAEGFVSSEDAQEVYLIGPRRSPVTIMVDKRNKGVSTISFCREEIEPGGAIPVHKHLAEDETIYVQYGSGLFTLGEKEYEVKAGSVAFVPKGVWHRMHNTGTTPLRMLFSYTPGGFENYFREIGVAPGAPPLNLTDEQWHAVDKKYGIVYKPR